MRDRPIRVGVIGCGRIAIQAHLPHLANDDRWDLVAVADLDPHRRKIAQRYFGVPFSYESGADLIEGGGIEAVLIATHELEHARVASIALAAGIHVFVEKPMAATQSDASHLIEAANQRDLVLMVGYQKLFDPCVEELRRMLKQGAIEPVFLRIHNHSHDNSLIQSETLPQYSLSRNYEAGTTDYTRGNQWDELLHQLGVSVTPAMSAAYRLVLNLTCHELAVLVHLFGKPTSIDHVDIWENMLSCVAAFSWSGDLRSAVETAQSNRPWYDEELWLYAEDKSVQLQWPSPFALGAESTLNVWSSLPGAGRSCSSISSGPASPFRREVEAFHAAIQDGVDDKATAEVARDTIELVNQIWDHHQRSGLSPQ